MDGWISLSEYQPKPCWEVPSLPNQSIQDSSGSEVKVTRQKAVITVIGTQYYSYERTDNSSWVSPQGVLPHSLTGLLQVKMTVCLYMSKGTVTIQITSDSAQYRARKYIRQG